MRWHRCIALLTFYLAATAAIQDGPHQCSTTQPVQVYKLNDAIWCETFCIPTSLVKTVEQFGDVLNGSCTQHAYTDFDHSLQTYLYGTNITVDMYKSSAPAAPADVAVRSAPSTDEVATAATDIYNALYQKRVGDGPAPTLPCILGNCAGKIAACLLDSSCRRGMLCTKDCSGTNQTCIFQCTSDYENEVYDNMIKCFFTDHDCMKMPSGQTFHTYGACKSVEQTTTLTHYLGKPLTHDKTKTLLTRNGKDQGYWLVARGLSHAYDCFDCQNDYFNVGGPDQPVATNSSELAYTSVYKIHKSDGTFRWNKAQYLAEFDTFPEAGRMHMHAPDYGGLVHDEDWRVLAVDERTEDEPEWIALYYCGGAPGVKESYEGACIMTPDGSMPSDPVEAKKIDAAYTTAGIPLASLHAPNNSAAACRGHPTPTAVVTQNN